MPKSMVKSMIMQTSFVFELLGDVSEIKGYIEPRSNCRRSESRRLICMTASLLVSQVHIKGRIHRV